MKELFSGKAPAAPKAVPQSSSAGEDESKTEQKQSAGGGKKTTRKRSGKRKKRNSSAYTSFLRGLEAQLVVMDSETSKTQIENMNVKELFSLCEENGIVFMSYIGALYE